MTITPLGTTSDGVRSVEIRCDEVSFDALIRILRRIPGATVSDVAALPMTDDAKATIHYKDIQMKIVTPFADYHLECASSSATFDEFVGLLRAHQTRWWEGWL
jgi:hypothetical protein